MNQLTIRGFDKDIEREIREIARKEKVSLNKAVLRILQHGLGSADRHVRSRTIGSTLDHLAGSWSEDEARAMDEIEKDIASFTHPYGKLALPSL